MSVFTTVTPDQLRSWLLDYPLGDLVDLKGIASGITNTNYFVTTTNGRYVLTLFEKNTAEELPFYLDLMTHFAQHGVPCPRPISRHDGACLGILNGKPTALVSCLQGRSLETPTAANCAQVGRILAEMHLAGQSFHASSHNQRGEDWRTKTASKVSDFLSQEDRAMLEQTMAFQADFNISTLPRGVIHADLFRDNVLFDGDRLSGLIDFYYACNDVLLYDVAIAVNDWCILEDSSVDTMRSEAMLKAYHAIRPLNTEELAAWPGLLRIAALRFWLSRLFDLYFPQAGELTHAKDPQHFQKF